MTYMIKIDKEAKKFIEKQPQNHKLRIYEAISKLPNGDTKKMKGYKNLYRLRVGSYRILYTFEEDKIIIRVTDANNRGDIYKDY